MLNSQFSIEKQKYTFAVTNLKLKLRIENYNHVPVFIGFHDMLQELSRDGSSILNSKFPGNQNTPLAFTNEN